jgi:alkylation response protein AidB-like acyl-CoA dehydrogenase
MSRWQRLSALAERDLNVARLAEAHADGLAILAELQAAPASADSRWGVWAAEIPGTPLMATTRGAGDQWQVKGVKEWCSGATLLTHALVTARRDDDHLLLAVDLDQDGVTIGPDTWAAAGMHGADTRTVTFSAVHATLIGPVDAYLNRPGFWIGAIGVAACWYGGSAGLAEPLRQRVATGPGNAHTSAHLGSVDAHLAGAREILRAAAGHVDAHPTGDYQRLALQVRAVVVTTAVTVADHVRRALGPAPMATDRAHAQRVTDLDVYIRQDHAERDLAVLGNVAAATQDWSL